MSALNNISEKGHFGIITFRRIREIISEFAEKQAYVDSVLDVLSNEITDKLFLDVIDSRPPSEESARLTLSKLSSPIHYDSTFAVTLVRRRINSEITYQTLQKAIDDLRPVYDKYSKKNNFYSTILRYRQNIVIVQVFRPGTDSMTVLGIQEKLFGYLEEISRKHKSNFAHGNVYYRLPELLDSYVDAESKLISVPESNEASLKAGNAASSPSVSKESDTVRAFEPKTKPSANESSSIKSLENKGIEDDPEAKPYAQQFPVEEQVLKRSAQQIVNYMLEGQSANAIKSFQKTIHQIFLPDFDPEQQLKAYRHFGKALQARLMREEHLSISSPGSQFLSLSRQKYDSFESLDQLRAYLDEESKTWLLQLANALDRQNNHFIVSAREYISSNYQDPDLSLTAVAEAIHVTPTYLSRLFHASMDIPFTKYLNQYRIDQSAKMLRKTDLPIAGIASACGFASVQNYIRVFKKIMLATPGQYRKQPGETDSFQM